MGLKRLWICFNALFPTGQRVVGANLTTESRRSELFIRGGDAMIKVCCLETRSAEIPVLEHSASTVSRCMDGSEQD